MSLEKDFSRSWLSALLASIVLAGAGHAELPKKMRDELDAGKVDLEKKSNEAQTTLLAAFDKRIAQTRALPKLGAVERQELIGSIEAEKAVFEKLGSIPFSPAMRNDTIAYLTTLQKAEIALAKAYDRAIDYQTKQKDDFGARALVAEKKTVLAPKTVAKWKIKELSGKLLWTWVLYSDGTTTGGSWTLDQRHLTVRHPNRKAPQGIWIDTCVVHPDGMNMDASNNGKGKFSGKLVVDEK